MLVTGTRLLCQLAEYKFLFCLPNATPPEAPKTCSFTFDDGYANNVQFLSLAEKHRLPFVLFVNSINMPLDRNWSEPITRICLNRSRRMHSPDSLAPVCLIGLTKPRQPYN